MKWEPYNYSIAFKEPYRIQDLGNLGRLPAPVAAVNIGTFLLILGIMLGFFRGGIHSLSETLPFLPALCYVGIPLSSVLMINKLQPDGKKIHYYIFDWIVYVVTIQLRDVVFYNGNACKRSETDEELRFN